MISAAMTGRERIKYRIGGSWGGRTIIRIGIQPPDADGRRPDDQLLAHVDSAAPDGWAERICELLNGDSGPPAGADAEERADVQRRIAESAEHRPSSVGDGLGYGSCVGCGQLWPCVQSRRDRLRRDWTHRRRVPPAT